MGITTLKDRSRFGLSLVLGGGEVKLLDMVSAFGVFATEGIKNKPVSILRIEDNKGKIIESFNPEPVEVIDKEVARLISNILSDNNARTPVFGPASPLAFTDRSVAAKTGTTNEFRDGWTLGYTPSLVAGVWAGNNDNTPTFNQPGVSIAAPIWREFILGAMEVLGLQQESFTPPEIVRVEKPVLNGQYIINGESHNILFYVDKNNPRGNVPQEKDSQFSNWEASVQRWLGFGQTPLLEEASSDPI